MNNCGATVPKGIVRKFADVSSANSLHSTVPLLSVTMSMQISTLCFHSTDTDILKSKVKTNKRCLYVRSCVNLCESICSLQSHKSSTIFFLQICVFLGEGVLQ